MNARIKSRLNTRKLDLQYVPTEWALRQRDYKTKRLERGAREKRHWSTFSELKKYLYFKKIAETFFGPDANLRSSLNLNANERKRILNNYVI